MMAMHANQIGSTVGGASYGPIDSGMLQDKARSEPPVARAFSELEKAVHMLDQCVGMLTERLHPVTQPVPTQERKGGVTGASCALEGQIKALTDNLARIADAVNDARNGLCI